MKAKWSTVVCIRCEGHGVYSLYGGEAVECPACEGKGHVYVLPSGHMFQYPGGPACGRLSTTDCRAVLKANGIEVPEEARDE